MNIQKQVQEVLHVRPIIHAKEEIRNRIDFLKEYCKKVGSKGFVLGISGGQDSSLAGRLAQLAVEELRSEGYDATFCAMRLPYGVQKDEEDAGEALVFIKPDETLVYNIKDSVDAIVKTHLDATGHTLADYHKGNVKARMRMIAQYAVAGERNCLVIGTDHAAEAVTGFFTKFGDGGADITPLAGLTKGQGRELLKELNASERLYLKTPTADLLDHNPGRADEDELGVDYEVLDQYLTGNSVELKAQENIEKRYQVTRHKRELPVAPYDTWWK